MTQASEAGSGGAGSDPLERSARPSAHRLGAIDLLRGLVVALMALDHTRDFFAPMNFNPLDLNQSSPAWFLTRWITHLCAPTFVLLAGLSAWLRGQRHSRTDMSRYLLSRGAMLVLLELSWVSFSWQFGFETLILQVIWAIGVAMMALGLLIWLPRWAVIAVAAGLILPHNLLDAWHSEGASWAFMLWHQGGFFKPAAAGPGVMVVYPLMPWIGWMAAGYALGPLLRGPAAQRQRFLLRAAMGLLLGFVLLRASGLYGDPHPWVAQGRPLWHEALAFIDVHKYPPSLLYLAITGAFTLAALALLERAMEGGGLQAPAPLMLFGRHAQFFYLLHIALIHVLAGAWYWLRYGALPSDEAHMPAGYAPSLWVCYGAWLGVLGLMWALCRAWSRWNRSRAQSFQTMMPK